MSSLTAQDLARIEEASRALLSPLAFADVDDWRRAVMQAARPVFGSRAASFALPGVSDRYFVGDDADSATLSGIEAYLAAPWQMRGSSPDPLVDIFFERVHQRNIEVWDWETIDWVMEGTARQAAFYNDVMVPGGLVEQYTLFCVRPQGSAHLFLHEAPARHRRPSVEARSLLRVLLPSFRAGIEALDRLAAHRATLDAVEEPLVIFNPDGSEVHRNRAFTRLLAADADAVRIEAAFARLARQMRMLGFPLHRDHADLRLPTADVETARTRYRLRACLLGQGEFGAEGAILISAQAENTATPLPTPEVVRERFGLTRREAETALLVAQGLSNDSIAERLFVSRHTVRHHVESIMAKLELTGRGREAVAARLMNLKAGAE